MKGKKEIYIHFFVMAVLVFYIKYEKGDKITYKLPDIDTVETEDVTKLTISRNNSETLFLKEDNKWFISPQKYPADPSAMDKMLGHISGLTLTALASESRSYAMYELGDDKKVEVKAYKGDTILRAISIGKPASSHKHTFIMLDNDHRVYHADGNIRTDFSRTVPELRDKKVMAVQDDIIEMRFQMGDKELTVVKATAPVSVDVNAKKAVEEPVNDGPKWTTSDNRRVKDGDVDSIIGSLTDYRCDEFIEGKTKDDFTSPVYTATFKGVKEYSISFYEKQDEKYPAVTTESEYPFLVSEWKAKKIMKELDSLIESTQ